jgi:hypothetical protein
MSDYDVVVGFHPDDDLPVPGRHNRWVSNFCMLLECRLKQMGLRPPARLWSFDDMKGYQRLSSAREEALRQARALVAVMSLLYDGPDPSYQHHWKELERELGPDDFATRLFRVYKLRPRAEPAADAPPRKALGQTH